LVGLFWRRTFTVAIVGADGSGKTSIADDILRSAAWATKYLYMGPAIGSSNYALPTSRLLNYLKRRAVKPGMSDTESLPPMALMDEESKSRLPRGRLIKALGLINRVAEEWYRQIILWIYRLRGYIVLCDRHYIFEYCPDRTSFRSRDEILSVRIHEWLLRNFYPRPDLVLFLDAPAEVLYQRKPEWPVEYLEKQRTRINEQGQKTRNFLTVDATRPFEDVLADVKDHISRFQGVRTTRTH
jgi:thymidylate kinase